jgi:hypothetical protein
MSECFAHMNRITPTIMVGLLHTWTLFQPSAAVNDYVFRSSTRRIDRNNINQLCPTSFVQCTIGTVLVLVHPPMVPNGHQAVALDTQSRHPFEWLFHSYELHHSSHYSWLAAHLSPIPVICSGE